MQHSALRRLKAPALGLALATASGCADETNLNVPDRHFPDASLSTSGLTQAEPHDAAEEDAALESASAEPSDSGTDAPASAYCPPVRAQRLPARLVAMSRAQAPDGGDAGSTRTAYFDDMFSLFETLCGNCHVSPAGLGGYEVSRTTFKSVINSLWINSMRGEDPTKIMPTPSVGGKLESQRGPGDPTTDLIQLMQAWMDQGKNDSFQVPIDTSAGPSPYVLSTEVGNAMTNLGNCLPDAASLGTETRRMDELDALFEQSYATAKGSLQAQIGLPMLLRQTDLFTLDTETLARHGVIAYAPAYPVFTDDARDLRHVRVPRNQSIVLDKTTQQFQIPSNTRLYRTVMKRVIDKDGSERWRKMETRLIVARPDDATVVGGGARAVTALYGTYQWDEDEKEARLVTDPLRSGAPFRDRTVSYVQNEPLAAQIRATKPRNLTYALQNAGALHTYVVPGSWRCVGCHMGSPSQDFVLGFTPLQISRRSPGMGGIIDPADRDELTQIDRFIRYGVISGLGSAADIAPLEASQGTRTPRNDKELVAQGYMLGNCTHCHNPRGWATTSNANLADFDLLPGTGDKQGIFRFPLDTMSPRITRGLGGTIPIPYITPSLLDYPEDLSTAPHFMPKYGTSPVPFLILAPWRSLIYRGVDTPFTYADDSALFPHMPMTTPGFDCRAPGIMADWMVSIPAVRKKTTIPEYNLPGGAASVDDSPQPYVEVKEVPPGDPGYEAYKAAKQAAEERLRVYHSNRPPFSDPSSFPSRFAFCPNNSDIIDHQTQSDPTKHPVPADSVIYRGDPAGLVMPEDGVPDNPHWVVSDKTDAPGDWSPRRTDWKDFVVTVPPKFSGPAATNAQDARMHEELVLKLLHTSELTKALREFAAKAFPLGLWRVSAQCDLSRVPKVDDLSPPPDWVAYPENDSKVDGRAAVYMQSPGSFVYNQICGNCHGPSGDSAGRQADNLSEMTGGMARVTNLRDGLFGPSKTPMGNVASTFGPVVATAGASADDWAARYFTWMGLGGTLQTIPSSILSIVANADVLGQIRRWTEAPADANMLSTAESLCQATLPFSLKTELTTTFDVAQGRPAEVAGPIRTNGDAELWAELCSIDNPPPVQALYTAPQQWKSNLLFTVRQSFDMYRSASSDPDKPAYPVGAKVCSDRGTCADYSPSDHHYKTLWCVRNPANDSVAAQKASEWVTQHGAAFCPPSLVLPLDARDFPPVEDTHITSDDDDMKRWAARGAINAGLVAYLYMQQLAKGEVTPQPSYDRCDLIGSTSLDGGK